MIHQIQVLMIKAQKTIKKKDPLLRQAMTESDHRFYDQSRYEKMYTWLYYNQSERGYMCKVCQVYYRNSPHFSGSNRGAWSHVSVKFNDNLGKKI